jgi:hypothetical protein
LSLRGSFVEPGLQREPKTGKIWFSLGFLLLDEEHVDTAVRELVEETD